MLKYNLKISIRYLLKNKLQSFLIIGGFSIGFAVFIMIMLFFYTEKSVNNGFANHKNIYRLYDSKKNTFNLNYNFLSAIDSTYTGISGICPMDFFNGFEFIAKDESSKKSITINNIICTENSFSRIFSANIIESTSGNLFDRKEAFAITKSLAQKLYGSQSAIGHTLSFGNDFVNFSGTITSVIEDLPENSSFKAEILLNGENKDYRFSTTCEDKCWNITSMFVQLNKNFSAEEITNQINKNVNLNPNEPGQIRLLELDNIYLSTLPLKDSHSKGNTTLLKIFLVIALLVLSLSAINYFNYSVSQQYAKFRTTGISKTTGANRKQLASYIITETILGIIVVSVLSILIVIILLPFSPTLFGKELISVNELLPKVIPVVLITMLLLIMFNSIVALYFQSQYKITDFFAGLKNRKGNPIGKKVLLTFQMTVSIALFASLLGLSKQIGFMKKANLGFNKDLLLRIDLPKKNAINKDAFQQEIEKLPFVAQSAYSVGGPGKITLKMRSNKEDRNFLVNCIIIGDNYLNTMGIELLKGREFQKGDINNVCLVNEEAVKQFEFTDIEGEKFYGGGKEEGYDIIGIIKNFHISSFYSSIEPVALIYNPDMASSSLSVRLSGTNLAMYTDQLGKVWEKFFPYEIMNLKFYDKEFEAMYMKEEKLLGSITFFSVIAIILTCMGILSQIIITSIKRTKEIGIRKVNGAQVIEIMTLLNKDFITWIIIAFVIACPVALYALHKWLENFAYKTTLSWWIFAVAGAVAGAVVILTVSWHSWRAATRNPVEALRYE
ncbi:MAG: ABC transporter permease [Bacteroidales bacterium]|nr:ABC transporter permease [Bacteroidales bacterium]